MALLRRLPMATTMGVLWWAYRNRFEVGRWASFAGGVPARLLHDGAGDVAVEARVLAALTADPATRNRPNIGVASVKAGVVQLRAPSGSPIVEDVRRVACAVSGVVDVRVEDPSLPLAPFRAAPA